MEPASFLNVEEKWSPEIKQYAANIPWILVGTQTDLRDNVAALKELNKKRLRPITREEGEKLAKKLGARAYVECSALLNYNIKQVFDSAIVSYFQPNRPKKNRFKKYFCWSTSKNF
jgi:GTPase SAR1 family protein